MGYDISLCNVAHQQNLSNSVLKLWQKVLASRYQHAEAPVVGNFEPVSLDDRPVFAYHRKPPKRIERDASRMVVVLNLMSDRVSFSMPHDTCVALAEYAMMESSRFGIKDTLARKRIRTGDGLVLDAYEGCLWSY